MIYYSDRFKLFDTKQRKALDSFAKDLKTHETKIVKPTISTSTFTATTITGTSIKDGVNRVFSRSSMFESSPQTITSAGALTLAHGLGATPVLVQCYLTNTSTELGYSVSDIVIINNHDNDAGLVGNRGISIVPDSTNLNIRFGANASAFALLNKGTGANGGITNSKWTFSIRAWA